MDEYKEMIALWTKPKFFMPIWGPYRSKKRHIDLAIEEGIPRKNCVNAENGDIVQSPKTKLKLPGKYRTAQFLVDQTGAIVSNIVVKDRVLLAEEGLVAVVLTVDKKTGSLLTSPDIISRGFIYMKDNEELMNALGQNFAAL
jgi:ribonuclease J